MLVRATGVSASRRRAAGLALVAALVAGGIPVAAQPAGTAHIAPDESVRVTLPAGAPKVTKLALEMRVASPGPVTVDVRSLDFDALVRLVRIGPDGGITPVGEDDDGGSGQNSRFTFDAAAAGVYRLEVSAANDQEDQGGEAEVSVSTGRPAAVEPAAKSQADLAYLAAAVARARERGVGRREAGLGLKRAIGLFQAGDYVAARSTAEQAATAADAAWGAGSLQAARAWNVAGTLAWQAGDPAAARPILERAVAGLETASGPESADVAAALNNMAGAAGDLGDYDAARAAHERALAIREKISGPDSPDVGQTLTSLGVVLFGQGLYDEARPILERALAIDERAFGPDHPEVAVALNNLAAVSSDTGDYAGARALFERALRIDERAMGPDHPTTIQDANNLATALNALGSFDEALALLRRTLAARESRLGPDSIAVAQSLVALGTALKATGAYGEARASDERALVIFRTALGPDNPTVARAENNLAQIAIRTGDFASAKASFERAIAIFERRVGPDTPLLVRPLIGLARATSAVDASADVTPILDRAVRIARDHLGDDHPDLADALASRARVAAQAGQSAAAFRDALQAEEISLRHGSLLASALPEQLALDYEEERPDGLSLAITLALRREPPGPDAAADAWDALIRSRAIVLDKMAARRRFLSTAADPATVALARAASEATRRLAGLVVRGPGPKGTEDYQRVLDQARRARLDAEGELARHSAAFLAQVEAARSGLREVARTLPEGTSLVAYAEYRREQGADTIETPRYAAFILARSGARPAVIDLGTAAEIDALVARWHSEAATGVLRSQPARANAEPAYREAGAALRKAVWDPVASRVRDARRVLVVPAGALALVSLPALPDRSGRGYLVERGPTFHTLAVERDLLLLSPPAVAIGRPQDPASSGKPATLLAVGGAAFDDAGSFAAAGAASGADVTAARPAKAEAQAFRGAPASCPDFRSLRFTPLPRTADEAREVATLAGSDAMVLVGAAATEAAVKQRASGRRLLHLATHGFFLGGACRAGGAGTRAIAGLVSGPAPAAAPGATAPPSPPENPLRLSGLALAGANRRADARPDEEDGILTAEEVSTLDLSVTEWAVLSACDTGLGDVTAGEGVLGLRRAFRVAGARTVIMSLWSVDDASTRRFMEALYEARFKDRLSTSEAMRQASLRVLRDRRRSKESTHPFYWAAFMASGDWR